MKKSIFLIILFCGASILLSSCGPIFPDEPNEYLPWCQDLYNDVLIEYPGFPQSFIGYCVATMKNGKPIAYQGMCGYEVVWQAIEEEVNANDPPYISITSRQECIDYFASME